MLLLMVQKSGDHQLRERYFFPMIYKVLALSLPGGWPWDFWTINSMLVSVSGSVTIDWSNIGILEPCQLLLSSLSSIIIRSPRTCFRLQNVGKNPIIYRVLHIPGGRNPWDFWTIKYTGSRILARQGWGSVPQMFTCNHSMQFFICWTQKAS